MMAAALAFVPLASLIPAGATGEQPAVHLSPSKTVHIDAPALAVPAYAQSRNKNTEQTPDNCRTVASAWCDVYPLSLDIPPDAGTTHWIVTVTLNWKSAATLTNVPELGNPSTTQYAGRIYYDPPCGKEGAPDCPADNEGNNLGDDGNGDQYIAASGAGTPPPAQIGAAEIDLSRKLAVTVALYLGQPEPYSLDIELIPIVIDQPTDLSNDSAIATTGVTPPKSTPPSATPASPAPPALPAPAAAPSASPSAALPATPGADLGPSFANGDVNGLKGVGGTDLTGDQLASLFTGRAPAALAPPGKASGFLLALCLFVLPLIVLVVPTGWMWRRRRATGF